ncbi:MAG TPA: hypothetical protein PLO88_03860, partial [Bacilli bacterium]|nr:hypothetical protein [Bacilli bacterium]
QCTYLSIGTTEKTHALLLVQPSWMWGGEMGINDCGVAIGNEAVFTKSSKKKQERLLGMDLLRLGLEHGSNAKQAAEIIIHYLETFGQGGNCGFDKPFYYDNSFLITDGKQALILETAKTDWVLKEVADFGNISNRLSIKQDYQLSSKPFTNFQKTNTEAIFTFFSQAKARQDCISDALLSAVQLNDIMNILRSHHPRDEAKLYRKGSVRSVCMHQSLLGDHTTSSMIVDYHHPTPTIWLTGASSPCLSIYKPCFLGINIAPIFTDKSASLNYWLEREYLTRAVFAGLIPKESYQSEMKQLQDRFIKEEAALWTKNPSPVELETFAKKCADAEEAFVKSYQKQIDEIRNNFHGLSAIWKKKMRRLGKNVFATAYRERNYG